MIKINVNKKIVIIFFSILLLFVVAMNLFKTLIYKPDFNMDVFNSYEYKYLNFINNDKYIFIEPKNNKNINTGIIFYPESLVDERAYLPLLAELSKEGYGVYIVKYPFKLPGLNKGTAQKIIKEDYYDEYVLMGHSLGVKALFKHLSKQGDAINKINSIILLAGYNDGTYDFNLANNKKFYNKVLSIIGTKDNIVNQKTYENYKINLPKNTQYLSIDGGNHSYYGNYGKQRNDGEAEISREKQQFFVIYAIKKFLSEFN